MQVDIHYYMTNYLALKAGWNKKDAQTLAWADAYTDDDKTTSVSIWKDWWKKKVQRDVIIPFHFLPNWDFTHAWAVNAYVVTPNSKLVQHLCCEAKASGDPYRLGIALHSLQDTFSHQGFVGLESKVNEVYWFKHLPNPLPNVGHANFGIVPDVVNVRWTDLRNGKQVYNNERFICAEKASFLILSGRISAPIPADFYYSTDYETRKKILMKAGGFGKYSKVKVTPAMIKCFREAAKEQLKIVREWVKE